MNQRVRDFNKMAEGFESKIQSNYEEFSGEIAFELKSVEDKVE